MVAEHLSIISNGKLQYTEAMKGEVYSSFYNKPSLERKNKYINVNAYDNSNRRNFQNNNYNASNRNTYNNNGNNHRFYQNREDNHGFNQGSARFKKRRPF